MTDEADRVPTTPNGYKPQIEKRPGLPDNVQIDTAHPRYRAHLEAAHRAGLSQRQFSAMLTSEVEVFARAQAEAQKKAAEPGKIPGYDKMTFAQKLAAAGHR